MESDKKACDIDKLTVAALKRRRLELEKETERLKKILKRAKSKVRSKQRSENQGLPYGTQSQYQNQTDSIQNSFPSVATFNKLLSPLMLSSSVSGQLPQRRVCRFPPINLVDIQATESEFCLSTTEFGEMMNKKSDNSLHKTDSGASHDADINTRTTHENVCSHSHLSVDCNKDISHVLTSHQSFDECVGEDCQMMDDCITKKKQTNDSLSHFAISADKCETVEETNESSNSHSRCLSMEFFSKQFNSQCHKTADIVRKSSSQPVQNDEHWKELRVYGRQFRPARKSMSFSVGDCGTHVRDMSICLHNEAMVSQELVQEQSENGKSTSNNSINNDSGLCDVTVSLQHFNSVEAVSCCSGKLLLHDTDTKKGTQQDDVFIIAVSTACHLVVWHSTTAANWQVLLALPLNKEEGEVVKQLSVVPVSSGICVVGGGNFISCAVRVYRIVSLESFSFFDVYSENTTFKQLCVISSCYSGLSDDYLVDATVNKSNVLQVIRHTMGSNWCEVVDCHTLPTLESSSDLHSLQSVSHSDMMIGTTSCCILVWNVISCLLLNSVSLGDVHIPLSLYCLSAVHDKEVIFLTLIHTSPNGHSGCTLVAYHESAGVCTKLVDYALMCAESKRFTGVGIEMGREIIAALEPQTVGVWNKLTGQCSRIFHHEVGITSTCCHEEKQLLLLGLADGDVLVIKYSNLLTE